jgi:hypothetical protein
MIAILRISKTPFFVIYQHRGSIPQLRPLILEELVLAKFRESEGISLIYEKRVPSEGKQTTVLVALSAKFARDPPS